MMPVTRTIDGERCTAHGDDARYVALTERSLFSGLHGVERDVGTLREMTVEVARSGARLELDADTKALIQDTMAALMDLVSETAHIGDHR